MSFGGRHTLSEGSGWAEVVSGLPYGSDTGFSWSGCRVSFIRQRVSPNVIARRQGVQAVSFPVDSGV